MEDEEIKERKYKEVKVLEPLVEVLLTNEELSRRSEAKLKLSASEIGGCVRKLCYSFDKSIPAKKADAKLMKIFGAGTSFHERFEDYLKRLEKEGKLKILMMEERLEDEELNFTGKCDSIVEISGEKYLLELKSCGAQKFRLLKEPQADHVIQSHAYMYLANKYKNMGVDKALIIYEDKNYHEMKEFLVPRQDEIEKDLKKKIRSIYSHVQKKTLPERPYEKDNWQCRYCDYMDYCWSHDD
jgi:CRISPR/Cas system-associated exonuclease Cas4 (RecB family)